MTSLTKADSIRPEKRPGQEMSVDFCCLNGSAWRSVLCGGYISYLYLFTHCNGHIIQYSANFQQKHNQTFVTKNVIFAKLAKFVPRKKDP
jgi:hypothetical protein